MKKTYTLVFAFALASMFFYSDLTGRATGTCTRTTRGLANNPATCSTAGCHIGVVTVGPDSLAGMGGAQTPNGISDITFTQGIAAYPTLASDFVSISTTAAISGLEYHIYGLDGRLVLTGSLPSYPSMTSIDVHGLPSAHYVVRVSDATNGASFRIIKK